MSDITKDLAKKYEELKALKLEIAELEKALQTEKSDSELEYFKDKFFIEDEIIYFLCYYNSHWILMSSNNSCYYDEEGIKRQLEKQICHIELSDESYQQDLRQRFLNILKERFQHQEESNKQSLEDYQDGLDQLRGQIKEVEYEIRDMKNEIKFAQQKQFKIEKILNNPKLTPTEILQ